MQAPWDRERLQLSPDQFERMVVEYLRSVGPDLKDFSVEHKVSLVTPDGEFEMDGVATFEALGADFVVLVECKHHTNPIKRELVQVLGDKLASTHGHKGMLFSTGPFQRGAIEYAVSRRIALVHFTSGGPVFETRGRYASSGPTRPYDAYFVTLAEGGGISYRSGALDELKEMLFAGSG